jgi:hypothetical protein
MRWSTRAGWRGFTVAAAATVFTSLAAACDLLSDPEEPRRAKEATLEVTGESPVPLVVITSKVWGVVFDEEAAEYVLSIIEADTAEVELPYQRTVPLAPTYRILFRVTNPDTEQDADVRMRVFLDRDVVYDQEATLRNASLHYSHAYH